jgi:hypothetical protein
MDKKLIQSTKRFTLSDNSVNQFGFRILTEGGDLSRLIANPVMLFMHERSGAKYAENISLPIGIWEDIKVEGDKITATPAFDTKDEFAMKIYNKVEAGILRMASIGAEPLDESCDPKCMLPGQTRATVTKWIAMEASIVDIGANGNALALHLSDKGRVLLNASNIDSYLPTLNSNKMIKLSSKTIIALALADTFTEGDIDAAVLQLSAKAADAEAGKTQAQSDLAIMKTAKEQLELQLSTQKVTALVDGAVAAGKITEKQKPHYLTLATGNYEATEALLKELPVHKTIASQLAAGTGTGNADKDAEFLKLSWDAIDKSNQLGKLKEKFPTEYAEKYEEKFGKKPS